MGVFSTRSPHRPNNIGLSLARIERVDLAAGKKKRRYGGGGEGALLYDEGGGGAVLHVLGLDLVDDTPIYDIKPYIPWDCVGLNLPAYAAANERLLKAMVEKQQPPPQPRPEAHSQGNEKESDTDPLFLSPAVSCPFRVPEWVTTDDELAAVRWTEKAKMQVAAARSSGKLSPLYPPTAPTPSRGGTKQKQSTGHERLVRPKGTGEGRRHRAEGERSMAQTATELVVEMASEAVEAVEAAKTAEEARKQESKQATEEVILAISEVVAQDPRAISDGRGQKTEAVYGVTFYTLRVGFVVGDDRVATIVEAEVR